MATVMMGLRRRVPANTGCSTNATGISSSSTSNKRSRSENNNSPSHGNLNSLTAAHSEPPAKKSRSNAANSTRGSNSTASENQTVTKSRGNSSRNGSSAKGEVASKNSGQSSPSAWSGASPIARTSFSSVIAPIGLSAGQTTMGTASLNASAALNATAIPYMTPSVTPSVATFVGNATNLNKNNSSVSYLDISNMTSGTMSSASSAINSSFVSPKSAQSPSKNGGGVFRVANAGKEVATKKFQNDTMFNAYQPWVIKTYGDLAKTKTITIKKYARILRTLRGEEANSAENSKFRFWVKSKGFHIGQPEGYDAKPADRIVGRHAVTSPGLDPPLYVPTQPPHNKSLNGAEGTIPPGRVYKKVAIVENFFDIIHAVHVDLEGRPGKHAGQKRTYRTITETYAFLPREAVTRFLLGCTECQRRPRTPSPTNLSAQSQTPLATSVTPTSPTPATTLSASPVQTSQRPREASHAPEGKSLFNYRHPKHQKAAVEKTEQEATATTGGPKDKEEKYNPLSITNLLKKDPPTSNFSTSSTTTATTTTSTTAASIDNITDSRRTPESDRASSRSSASSKRRRMLPEGRTPSPQPSTPLARPWSPSIDPKDTPIDYSLPITTTYLKHQQRVLAEKTKASKASEVPRVDVQVVNTLDTESLERERFSPAAGLIDTNLNLLATIQHLHCQVMLALTERLRPAVLPASLVLPQASSIFATSMLHPGISIPSIINQNHS
ncbi:mucin-17 [Athalia rosae]|uniref:mucin-17 n=1 Tax=Athalia rosae TaxID=37344 RepID=UPI0020346486|nr:mucin-17 [Athalia rosae]XP_048507063.1 mucin-17 [Athalia rosae]XP_048507064.1 mucin-17 [Athalia rosae]XP_048507065.1 mucin-17 [Athalia rosae]